MTKDEVIEKIKNYLDLPVSNRTEEVTDELLRNPYIFGDKSWVYKELIDSTSYSSELLKVFIKLLGCDADDGNFLWIVNSYDLNLKVDFVNRLKDELRKNSSILSPAHYIKFMGVDLFISTCSCDRKDVKDLVAYFSVYNDFDGIIESLNKCDNKQGTKIYEISEYGRNSIAYLIDKFLQELSVEESTIHYLGRSKVEELMLYWLYKLNGSNLDPMKYGINNYIKNVGKLTNLKCFNEASARLYLSILSYDVLCKYYEIDTLKRDYLKVANYDYFLLKEKSKFQIPDFVRKNDYPIDVKYSKEFVYKTTIVEFSYLKELLSEDNLKVYLSHCALDRILCNFEDRVDQNPEEIKYLLDNKLKLSDYIVETVFDDGKRKPKDYYQLLRILIKLAPNSRSISKILNMFDKKLYFVIQK